MMNKQNKKSKWQNFVDWVNGEEAIGMPKKISFKKIDFEKLQEDFELTVPKGKELHLLLASDRDIYGGTKQYKEVKETVRKLKKETISLTLSPYSAVYFRISE